MLAWLLVRWLRLRDDRLLLALGAVAGIAAETTFQVLLLCAVLLLSVLVLGPRELLRSYGYFPPPPEGQDAVLYVGSSPDEVRPHFIGVRKVADGGTDASVWLCTGKREPWASLWPRLRHLSVS